MVALLIDTVEDAFEGCFDEILEGNRWDYFLVRSFLAGFPL